MQSICSKAPAHINKGADSDVIKPVAKRKNFKLLFSAGIILAVEVLILYFHPMKMIQAILLGWHSQVVSKAAQMLSQSLPHIFFKQDWLTLFFTDSS